MGLGELLFCFKTDLFVVNFFVYDWMRVHRALRHAGLRVGNEEASLSLAIHQRAGTVITAALKRSKHGRGVQRAANKFARPQIT